VTVKLLERVLVTGANGLLGTEIVKLLKQRKSSAIITTDMVGHVDFQGNLSDAGFVNSLPEADVVIHCAAVQYVSSDLPIFLRNEYFEKNNVMVARNLTNRFSGNIHFFLNVGTSMMYSVKGLSQISTESSMEGNGVYSSSKLRAWKILASMDNPIAMMVPSIIAGPGRGGLFTGFIRSMAKNGVAVIPGQGNLLTQMVHVHDAASLAILIAMTRTPGIFNAGGPKPETINSWVNFIASELRISRVRRVHVPMFAIGALARLSLYRLLAREQITMLQGDHVLDTTTSQVLGWHPKYSNEEIIRDTASHSRR
jgi:nucleoside-diphosphate-sugar epimerase